MDAASRAALIFLATVAMKRAGSMNTDIHTQNTLPKDLDVSLYQDRAMAYSTIRSRISGVKRVRFSWEKQFDKDYKLKYI